MAQIHSMTENQSQEYIEMQIAGEKLDFSLAKQAAKDKAFERCDHPMILSWKNGRTGKPIRIMSAVSMNGPFGSDMQKDAGPTSPLI